MEEICNLDFIEDGILDFVNKFKRFEVFLKFKEEIWFDLMKFVICVICFCCLLNNVRENVECLFCVVVDLNFFCLYFFVFISKILYYL